VRLKAEMTAKGQCKGLIEERFPEGLIRMLAAKFSTARYEDLEDAVADAFVKYLAKGEALESPAGYITVVAKNRVRRLLTKAAREILVEADSGDETDDGQWADPVAEKVIGKETFELVRGIVEGWQSTNVRSATLLVIEAVELEEPISSAELAAELESLLGEEVDPDTVRQWRKRGLDRLRRELYELDEIEVEKEAQR
jgi:DNA-directed RNA polymerase specialized sigma24 family protein